MNIQEYISSGIVESYVMGLAEPQERTEFEQMCVQYPEVRAARDAFENALEQQLRGDNLQPPASLKEKVFSTIEAEQGHSSKSRQFPLTAVDSRQLPPTIDGSNDRISGSVVRREPSAFLRMLAAAAVVLLVLSTALNVYFFNRYREYNERYQALLASQTDLAQYNEVLQTRLLEYEKSMEMMKDPAMAIVKMPAIPASPDPTSATIVYWDTRTKDVYLAVSKLPKPATDQQYQLWAMVDGKPVDAGVFDMNAGTGMIKMENIPRAEAFAITLEKRGSPTPSLDKLYVMGKV